MSLVSLSEAFVRGGGSSESPITVRGLVAALTKAASGGNDKENSSRKSSLEAAQQCFKTVQQQLAHPPSGRNGVKQLVALGRASLTALAALSPASASQQLSGWRYNFARRLVSCKAFSDAQQEAWVLFQQLSTQQQPSASGGTPSAEAAANLLVGTALTLVLCCVEGQLFDSEEALQALLQAAESLPAGLSQLKADEAAKHGEAAHRYLYKAAVVLLDRRSWRHLPAVCSSLLVVAGGQAAAQLRAMQAVGKLVAHMPEEQAAAALAAVAVCLGRQELCSEAASCLLGLLCSAVEQATSAATSQHLHAAVLSCAGTAAPAEGGQAVLQAAALLLPALALQQPGHAAGAWVQPVAAVEQSMLESVQQLEAQLAATQRNKQPMGSVQQQLAALAAASQTANTLRRQLAVADKTKSRSGSGGGGGGSSFAHAVQHLGGPAAAATAAAVLELGGPIVGVYSRVEQALCGKLGGGLGGTSGHTAAVALVAAARLRAACPDSTADDLLCSSRAVSRLLGWDLQAYCAGSTHLPPAACAVDTGELAWLASALFNLGVDLLAAQRYQPAVPALQAAVAAAAVGLQALAAGGTAEPQEVAARAVELGRKSVALSDAQQQAGDGQGALGSLAHCIALVLQLGCLTAAAAWQPMVEAFVRLQAELPVVEECAPGEAVSKPSRRNGNAAVGKKGPAAAASSRSRSSASHTAPDVLLLTVLQQREAGLPAGSTMAVLQHELHTWAVLLSSPLAVGGLALARWHHTARQLLQGCYSAHERPAEHAALLLLLHQLKLSPEQSQAPGAELLQQAIAVLEEAPGPAATGSRATARCLLAVGCARQLASGTLLEQQQERQRSHAAASTSAAGSSEQDAAAAARLAGGDLQQPNAAEWQHLDQLVRQAQAAVQAAGSEAQAADDGLQAAAQELSYLAGLLGISGPAQQQQQQQQQQQDVLASCLFPGAAGSAADLELQAQAAAAEGRRSSRAAVRRSQLHGQAAEAFAGAGDMVPALYHASESHRLLAALFQPDSAHELPPSGGQLAAAAPVGWWRLTAAYLSSLLQLGQLFEAAGLADEALHALREAQRLAVAAGAQPFAALVAARLADVYCKQGQLEVAEQAVAIARQQLGPLPVGASLALGYCRAAVQLAQVQLSIATSSKAAAAAAQEAVSSCEALAASAAAAGPAQRPPAAAAWCNALLAAALLAGAEAALQRDNRPCALQLATSAWDAASGSSDGGPPCSALRCQQAAALLFLGQHSAAEAPAREQLAVLGLGQASSASAASTAPVDPPAAPRGRARRAAAKPAAGRSRGKAAAGAAAAAAAAAGEAVSEGTAASVLSSIPVHKQQLWHALQLSRGMLCIHRSAAGLLAVACGRQGHLHLAAWLLHCSLGAAMRLQYQLVLHSRCQQLLQRGQRADAAANTLASQAAELARLGADVLEPGLDWQLVQQLAGLGVDCAALQQSAGVQVGRGRKGAASRAPASAVCEPATVLAALNEQARQQLLAWQAALPAGTAVCSVSCLPGSSGGSHLLISRLAPTEGDAAAGGQLPPLLVALPVQQLSASLSCHPIRALRMDDAAGSERTSVGSVQSVLDEMAAVLANSGRSMRDMSTDTREQQREWWRVRLSLDDRLAGLVKHVDSSWLGPWRGLLLGDAGDAVGSRSRAHAAAQRLADMLQEAGQPASQQQAAVLQHAAAALSQQARCGASLAVGEARQAARQLCDAAGLVCSQEQQQEVAALLAGAATAGSSAEAAEAQAVRRQRAGTAKPGKSVKFADQAPSPEADEQQQQQQQEAEEAEQAPPPARTTRARKPAAAAAAAGAARSRRSAAAPVAEQPAACGDAGADVSPVATLAAVGGSLRAGDEDAPPLTEAAPRELCQVFDRLSLGHETDAAPHTAPRLTAVPGTAGRSGGATARSGKHRSRLRLMQAGTPGRGTSLKPRAAAAGAATAPRAARELPLTVAKTAPPPAARPGSSADSSEIVAAAAAEPVLLVLDGALQALPWESCAGLMHRRVYRMPSLPCAAATAQRADLSVDLSSTFYALNPGGDLAATQATFQTWFAGMRGWEGKAGSAPSSAEMATALTSHQFFLYCGHGGGEQYISAAKLRSLERCSAALLMGCSSGRLRAQAHYEPVGAVLAYLLAGCPAAVANLWDVTDKDIDRFSQALLSAWISGASGGSSNSSGDDPGAAATAGSDMAAAVAGSRGTCKLPHLVGAAPVCYGIPSRLYLDPA